MVEIGLRDLKKNILTSLGVKSHKILKKKIIKLYSLDKFISICVPFIFSNKFSKYEIRKDSLRITIFHKIKEILITITFLLNYFLKKKNIKKINLEKKIFFFTNKLIDQYNIFPLSNFLLKKNINHSLLYAGEKEKLNQFNKLFKKEILNITNFITISNFISGYFIFVSKKKEIKKIFKIFNFGEEEKKKILIFYKYFFIYHELYKRLFKNKTIKIVVTNKFNTPELCALIYHLKYVKKEKNFLSVSYPFIGQGGESALYLHSNSDIILTTSKADKKIIDLIKKITFLPIPKLKPIGTVRNEILKNKFNKKIDNKKINILYIKSNNLHYNDIDDKALRIFIKSIKKFKNKIKFKIKDRHHGMSKTVKQLIDKKSITKKNLVDDKENFIEKSINEADICIGTCSSALSKQAVWMKKPVIQLFKDKLFMYKIKSTLTADNEKDLELILKRLLQKRYLRKIKIKADKIYKKTYFINQCPIQNFYRFFKAIN